MKTFFALYIITIALAMATIFTMFESGYSMAEPNEDHETLTPVSCADHNFDVRKIASAVRQKITKEQLFLHLGKGSGLEVERIKAIRALIEDAYRNADSLTAWYDNHLWICTEA